MALTVAFSYDSLVPAFIHFSLSISSPSLISGRPASIFSMPAGISAFSSRASRVSSVTELILSFCAISPATKNKI